MPCDAILSPDLRIREIGQNPLTANIIPETILLTIADSLGKPPRRPWPDTRNPRETARNRISLAAARPLMTERNMNANASLHASIRGFRRVCRRAAPVSCPPEWAGWHESHTQSRKSCPGDRATPRDRAVRRASTRSAGTGPRCGGLVVAVSVRSRWAPARIVPRGRLGCPPGRDIGEHDGISPRRNTGTRNLPAGSAGLRDQRHPPVAFQPVSRHNGAKECPL